MPMVKTKNCTLVGNQRSQGRKIEYALFAWRGWRAGCLLCFARGGRKCRESRGNLEPLAGAAVWCISERDESWETSWEMASHTHGGRVWSSPKPGRCREACRSPPTTLRWGWTPPSMSLRPDSRRRSAGGVGRSPRREPARPLLEVVSRGGGCGRQPGAGRRRLQPLPSTYTR